ncbi:uncharacterized protein M421DRAFT_287280 [Didymella exigua CBS 183.55]|uniref:C2H2-type domain-containing protein n=1 Tax=Didymella exigua CBS 183.55 TaxID=1150837 RepID=A0A6A5S173_9PLEO|nr:uncharacterized protein M421DRAFT_287280 [Didymella exigua CBS 183.55]KAF1932236.1 hypothetical protein M421DRAFT_287280 [Didymella exigua CBS 183.55]
MSIVHPLDRKLCCAEHRIKYLFCHITAVEVEVTNNYFLVANLAVPNSRNVRLNRSMKHMLKHKKNFVCGETGCKRSGKGFSTINDLDRHRKSVHKINTTKSISYQCAASACANKDKIWPRLDNFKQHVERMHKEDDMCELIKLSECHLQEAPEAQQPLSVDPALLAGIGDLNHSLIATSAYGLAYHSPMSFNTTSMSSVSEVSPSTTPFNLSVSQLGAPPSMGDAANTRRQDSAALSRTVSSTSADRLRSTKALPSVVASTLTSMRGQSNNCESTPKLQLSTAPQTKAEQQIQALEKFSKANINIDEIMQLVLGAQQQQNSSSRGEHADIERRQTLQAIADLLKPKPKPMRLQKRGLNQGSTPGTRQCDYEGCNVFGRPCDLNKHKKRHEKPYGCTYPKCPKIFGAKSDWKRHENSQHFQLEAFRCDLANKAGKKCGQHCYRPMQFQKHIEEKHKITPGTQVKVHLQRCRIGKNCQDQFWCGFCGKIITLASKRNAAWDERFDHIARHFEREQKRIDTWLCVEENKTKKQLHDDMDRRNFADEDVGENEADHGLKGDDELVSQMDRSSAETYQPPTHDDSRKRTIVSNPSRAQPPVEKPNPTILWSCCKCHDGPFTYSVHLSCAECSNAFCDRCPRFYADDNEF